MANTKLYDSHRPALVDGHYVIEVTQTLEVSGHKLITPLTSIQFEVAGEQYALDQQQIHTLFPPAGSLGNFTLSLPHIVLNRSTLPWERKPGNDDSQKPWLALVLVTEDENGELDKAGKLPETVETNKVYSLHIPKSVFESNPFTKPLAQDPASSDKSEMVSILVAETEFLKTTIIPDYESLRFLVHVRSNEDEGIEKAYIVGSRLPKMDRKNSVHLVSLENCFDASGNFNGNQKVFLDANANKFTALVSLKSWSFFCNDHFIITEEVLDEYKISNGLPNGDQEVKDATLSNALSELAGKEYFNESQLLTDLQQVITEQNKESASPEVKNYTINDSNKKPKKEYLLNTFRIGHLPQILKHLNRTPGTLRSEDYLVDSRRLERFLLTTPISDELKTALSASINKRFYDANKFIAALGLQLDETTTEKLKSTFKNPCPNYEKGFIDLSYTLNTGQNFTSLYRGPLVPISQTENITGAQKVANTIPLLSADNAFRYLSSAKMLDCSYAAAWELGRMLALQNKKFSIALYEWKRACSHVFKLRGKTEHRHLSGAAPKAFYPSPPKLVEDWFAKLKVLESVPYNYLVPDPAFLPFESIRFFTVDENWINYLIDGAFSIGRVSRLDQACDEELYTNHPFLNVGTTIRSGFILHSVAVSGWPDMIIDVRTKNHIIEGAGNLVSPLRKDKLAHNLLFCLYDANIQSISMYQKPESIHFGFDEGENDSLVCNLPEVTHQRVSSVPVPLIPGVSTNSGSEARKINITGLINELKSEDKKVLQFDGNLFSLSPSPASLANFLVEKTEEVMFILASSHE